MCKTPIILIMVSRWRQQQNLGISTVAEIAANLILPISVIFIVNYPMKFLMLVLTVILSGACGTAKLLCTNAIGGGPPVSVVALAVFE